MPTQDLKGKKEKKEKLPSFLFIYLIAKRPADVAFEVSGSVVVGGVTSHRIVLLIISISVYEILNGPRLGDFEPLLYNYGFYVIVTRMFFSACFTSTAC